MLKKSYTDRDGLKKFLRYNGHRFTKNGVVDEEKVDFLAQVLPNVWTETDSSGNKQYVVVQRVTRRGY